MPGRLTGKQERLLVLFKQAIEREQDAQKLYSQMLYNCEDPELKQLIESFRAAEQKHEKMRMNKYTELRKTGKYQD